MYVHEDISIPIIMQSRLLDSKRIKFRADLGFNQINLILKKEQSVVIPLLKAFSAEKIKQQHKALKNERLRTDMYFSELKVAVEIDEKGDTDRKQDEENKRRKRKKKKKKKKKNILTTTFLTGFVLIQRVLIFFLKLVKYKVALLNQIRKKEKKKRKSN